METLPPNRPEQTQTLPNLEQNTEQQQNSEVLSQGIDRAKLAVHGIAGTLRTWQRNRAAERMERLDHQEALYSDARGSVAHGDLGHVAETASGEQARPRTIRQSMTERRADKRALERDIADLYAYRAERNSRPGMTERQKTHAKMSLDRSNMSAREIREASTRIDASPRALGVTGMKYAKKRQRKQEHLLQESTGGIKGAEGRILKRGNAIEAIKKHHHKANRHRDAILEIRSAQAQREAERRIREAAEADTEVLPTTD